MKKLLIAVIVLFAVLVILVGIAASQAGTIIRHAVGEFGPEITGTSVTLSDVDISILSGKAGIKNLQIGNPAGFKAENAIKVGEVSIELDINSLFSDKIKIKQILVDGAELTYEVGKGGSNIKALQRNIEQRSATTTSGADAGASESAGGPSLIIDDVRINGTKVNLAASLLQGQGASATLPDIHLQDIGKEEGGASPADAVKEIFGVITKTVATSVAQIVPADQLKETADKAINEKIKGVGDKLKGLFGEKE